MENSGDFRLRAQPPSGTVNNSDGDTVRTPAADKVMQSPELSKEQNTGLNKLQSPVNTVLSKVVSTVQITGVNTVQSPAEITVQSQEVDTELSSGMNRVQSPGLSTVQNFGARVNLKSKSNVIKQKVKTEPTNPYGLFLKEKRLNEGKVNLSETHIQWSKMSGEEKAKYEKLYEEEKLALGDNYRVGRKRKSKVESIKTKEEKSLKKKDPKGKKVEPTCSNVQLLTQAESLDIKIDQLHIEAKSLQDKLCAEKVKLAVNQYELKENTCECHSLKEKYKALLSQHSICLE